MKINDPNMLAHQMMRKVNDMFNTFHQKYVAVAAEGKSWKDAPLRQKDKHRTLIPVDKIDMAVDFLDSDEWLCRVDELAAEGASISVEVDAVLPIKGIHSLTDGTTLAQALQYSRFVSKANGFAFESAKIALRITITKHPTYDVKLPRGVKQPEAISA